MAVLLLLSPPAMAEGFQSKAPRAFMIDAATGAVLYAKGADEPFPPGSLAKLMTMELVFRDLKQGQLSLEQTFFVSEHAWRTGGAPSRLATMFAEVKSSVPLEALIRGAVVQLANDACIVIAEAMAGSESDFARLMNARARALGLESSTFVNPTGLPAEGQQVTAREITALARHLWLEYPAYYRYFAEPAFEWNGIYQRNRNPLLALEVGVDGLVAGHADQSGYAIAASAREGGRRIFVTLSGLDSAEERLEEARSIIEWGLRGFEERRLFANGETVGEVEVYGGGTDRLPVRTARPLSLLVPVEEPERLTARIVYRGPVPAPVEEGEEVATLQIRLDGTLSREVPLHAARSVERGSLRQRALEALGELLLGWLR